MRFYKLTNKLTGDDYYLKPEIIDLYWYTEDSVMIRFGDNVMDVSKSDFENMMILEGVDEY